MYEISVKDARDRQWDTGHCGPPSSSWVSVCPSLYVRLLTVGVYSYTNLGSRTSFSVNSKILFVLILDFRMLNRLTPSVNTAGIQFSAW